MGYTRCLGWRNQVLSKRTSTAAQSYAREVDDFNRQVSAQSLGNVGGYHWYHTIELTDDLVTPGLYDHRSNISAFAFPTDMGGLSALDVGSATGFFAFELERRGAEVISIEVPSLADLDRFPGQTVDQTVAKIDAMLAPGPNRRAGGPSVEQCYFNLLEGPFRFCHRLLNSKVERRYSTVYELSAEKLGSDGFDLVFMGDVLLHTLHPLEALAAAARLCRGTLVLSQFVPDMTDDRPAMLYVGGDDPGADELSWWWPNQACLTEILLKLGFADVALVGTYSGVLKSTGYEYKRSILHARRG